MKDRTKEINALLDRKNALPRHFDVLHREDIRTIDNFGAQLVDGEMPYAVFVAMVVEDAMKAVDETGTLAPLEKVLQCITGHNLRAYLRKPKGKRAGNQGESESNPALLAARDCDYIAKLYEGQKPRLTSAFLEALVAHRYKGLNPGQIKARRGKPLVAGAQKKPT